MKNHDTSLFKHFQRLLRDGSIARVSFGLVGYTLGLKYRRLRTVRLHTTALLATALICCVAGGPVAAQTASPPSIVVPSGSAAPGGGVFIIDSVVTPVINASGQIAFRTALSGAGSSDGIFAGAPGSLQAVARQGDAASAGGNYNIVNSPVFNSNGQVAFTANTSVNGNGQFARTLGFPTTTAALVGTPSPTGDNYSTLNANPVVNAAGQVAFLANLNTPGAGTQGIFAGTPGTTLATAALLGNPAPAGGNYQQLTSPAINSAGKVLFRASLTGASYGLFYGTPGTTLTTVALSGTPSPAGGNYGVFSSTPTVNSAGQVAFVADVGSSNTGIFAGTAGTTLTPVAISGNAAPAGGNYSLSLGNPALNAAGQVAFLANLTGGSSNRGIFVGTPGQPLQTIALHGGAAPNAGGAIYSGISQPSLNASGQVAFTSNLTGTGVNFSNGFGLYAGSPGNVVQIVRTGDLVDIDPTAGVDNRVVSFISFLSSVTVPESGGQDGRNSSFNNSGFLVYRLDFTSGGRAIFMSNIAPVSTPGDFNGDGAVDGRDFLEWQRGDSPNPLSAGDLADWRTNYGAGLLVAANVPVPEPATLILLMLVTAGGWAIRRTA